MKFSRLLLAPPRGTDTRRISKQSTTGDGYFSRPLGGLILVVVRLDLEAIRLLLAPPRGTDTRRGQA